MNLAKPFVAIAILEQYTDLSYSVNLEKGKKNNALKKILLIKLKGNRILLL